MDETGTSVKTQTIDMETYEPDNGGDDLVGDTEEVGIDVDDYPETFVFHVNRPFAVFIKDKDKNFIAFACCINDLAKALP